MKDEIKVILMALECILKTVASNEVKPWKISKEEFEKYDQARNNYIQTTIKCINEMQKTEEEKNGII